MVDRNEDPLRDELRAVLAASREFAGENDDALADLFLEHMRSRQMVETHNPPTRRGGNVVRGRLVPIAITIGTGTFLSVAAALMSGATTKEFLLVWVFTTLVMAAVVQIGLLIGNARQKPDRLVK